MKPTVFEKRLELKARPQDAWDWHANEGAFQRLLPPWENVEILSGAAGVRQGETVEIKATVAGIGRTGKFEIESAESGKRFVDRQLEGPFGSWQHEHIFEESAADGCILIDRVSYELPAGILGKALGSGIAESRLGKLFAYRHAITKSDVEQFAATRRRPRWRVLISGGYGLLGSRLRAYLSAQGHDVSILSRSPRRDKDVKWDLAKEEVDPTDLEGFDVVYHLAGKSIASGKWTESRKKEIWNSRVDGTRFLVSSLAKLRSPPSVFACASGIGYYGDTGEAEIDEDSPKGESFLADLCEVWEKEAIKAEAFAESVFFCRSGTALDAAGGALERMLPPFRMGVGGPLGSGDQWMPWIASEDWIRVAEFLAQEKASGPFNFVSPRVARNRTFTKALGEAIGRPTIFKAPRFALKGVFGEFADEGLLASCRACSTRLMKMRFDFRYPDLKEALQLTLGEFEG